MWFICEGYGMCWAVSCKQDSVLQLFMGLCILGLDLDAMLDIIQASDVIEANIDQPYRCWVYDSYLTFQLIYMLFAIDGHEYLCILCSNTRITAQQSAGLQLCNWALRYKYHQFKTWWGSLNPSCKVRREVQFSCHGLILVSYFRISRRSTAAGPCKALGLCVNIVQASTRHNARHLDKPGHNENSIRILSLYDQLGYPCVLAELMAMNQVGNWLGLIVM